MRLLLAVLLASPAAAQAPAFTSLQPEAFSVPGSYSNAWADFDADGDPDLAVSLKGGAIRLYRNDAGRFTDIGPDVGFPGAVGGEYRGLSWADFDNDGQLDLYAGSSLPKYPSLMLRQQGRRFTNVAPALGLELTGRSSRQNNLVDIDGDGDLDLFASDRLGVNKLFRNEGGRFVQIFADQPITSAQSTVGACWLDYDQDGDLDLFLANQSGKDDQLWRNDGAAGLVDMAPALGINSPGRTLQEGGVGCAIGDFDTDGTLDIFVPNYGRNALWRGLPGGGF
jgi:FG-GAP-like repeat